MEKRIEQTAEEFENYAGYFRKILDEIQFAKRIGDAEKEAALFEEYEDLRKRLGDSLARQE